MIELDPNDDQELAFALLKAYKRSGLNLEEISEQLRLQYGVEIGSNAVSRSINRTGVRLQTALQFFKICGGSKGSDPRVRFVCHIFWIKLIRPP